MALRRQRLDGKADESGHTSDPQTRFLLWDMGIIFGPPVVAVALGIWSGSAPLAYLAIAFAIIWPWFSSQWRTGGYGRLGVVPAPQRVKVSQHLLQARAESERADQSKLPPLGQMPLGVVEGMWFRFGSTLLSREAEVQAIAADQGWSFRAYDAMLSERLDHADVTTYSPEVCRNICDFERNGVEYTITDLTGVTYDSTNPYSHKHSTLWASTMCITSFSAPRELRIVKRGHRLLGPGPHQGLVETESSDFNKKFLVIARNSSWARLVLNPAVVARLVSSNITSMVIDGGKLALVTEPWVAPHELLALANLTSAIRASALTGAAPGR